MLLLEFSLAKMLFHCVVPANTFCGVQGEVQSVSTQLHGSNSQVVKQIGKQTCVITLNVSINLLRHYFELIIWSEKEKFQYFLNSTYRE